MKPPTHFAGRLLWAASLVWACGAAFSRAAKAEPAVALDSLESFTASAQAWLPERLAHDAKLWRQIAPSVWWLLRPHAEVLRSRSDRELTEMAASAAAFVIRKREEVAMLEVIAPGRPIVALLDPDRGLDRRQITTLASAYGTNAEVFKLERPGDSLESVASAWLESVAKAVDGGGTVVVVGHGLPREIQSYHVTVRRLADTIADASRKSTTAGGSPGNLVLVFDDCFSADFCLNLASCLVERSSGEGSRPIRMPVMIAGANRDQYGHVDVGEKFVTHFWEVVIELYFIRTPRPRAITLGDFLGPIDNAMYGFGRTPIVEGGRVTGYRLVDARLVQDPVCFVPLDERDVEHLRRILGLPDAATLLPILDAG